MLRYYSKRELEFYKMNSPHALLLIINVRIIQAMNVINKKSAPLACQSPKAIKLEAWPLLFHV